MPRKHATGGKTRITIRIDDDTLAWFRDEAEAAEGGSYQTLINRALREYVQNRDAPLEETLRRVLREELAALRVAAQPAPVGFKTNTRLPG